MADSLEEELQLEEDARQYHASLSEGRPFRERIARIIAKDDWDNIPDEFQQQYLDDADDILWLLDRDPGHNATDGLVAPTHDRSHVLRIYLHIIGRLRDEGLNQLPDGGSAF